MKEKTTKQKQSKIVQLEHSEIPRSILMKHNKEHLMVDYMFVQGIQFLTTISSNFNFKTVEALPYKSKKGAKKDDILNGVKRVINLYQSRGLLVQQINSDNEFECIMEEIKPILLNISAADEHVSQVERLIQTIKERTRCQVQHLPYAKYPRSMVIGCVIFATKSLNNEVDMSRLSDKHSPSMLITGRPQPKNDEVTSLMFGEYVEVYSGTNAINTNEECTTSAVALYPSGNLQRGWMFLSLNTGQVIHRHQRKRLPIIEQIINRVEEIATKEKKPYIPNNFKYKWNKNLVDETCVDSDEVSYSSSNE